VSRDRARRLLMVWSLSTKGEMNKLEVELRESIGLG